MQGDGIRRWCVEGCVGTVPLRPLAGTDVGAVGGPERGAIVTVGVELDTADGPMLACEPVVLAARLGGTARRLAPDAVV